MKKLSICLLCFLSSAAYASPRPSFDGFTLRGALGATSARFDVSPNTFADDFFIDYGFKGENSLVATSPAGLLGLGYFGHLTDLFVLGFEFTGSYANTQAHYNTAFDEILNPAPGFELHINITNIIETQLTNDFAFLIKPGIISRNNTLFYLLFGPRLGNFETRASTSFLFSQPPNLATAEASGSVERYEFGFTAGAGLQHKMTENLHLSLEYAYTSYDKIRAPENFAPFYLSGVFSGVFVTNTPEIKVSSNTVMLGLSYQWQ